MNLPRTKFPLASALLVPLTVAAAVFAQEQLEAIRPVVSLSLNGRRETVALSGTPVLIKTAFLNSGAAEQNIVPLRLAVDNGAWTNALQIEIRGSDGSPALWKLTPAAPVEAELHLTDKFSAVSWWLAPEDSAALPQGTHKLRAIFDTRALQRTDAWQGLAQSIPATLHVQAVPPVLTDAQLEQRQVAFAQYWQHDPARALAALDELLTRHPTNLGGLTLKTAVLRNAGQIDTARTTLDEAFNRLFSAVPEPPEPPALLLELATELEAAGDIVIRTVAIAGSTLTLVWDSEPNRNYTVERSMDLRSWETFAVSIRATEANTIFRTNTTGAKTFFRVVR